MGRVLGQAMRDDADIDYQAALLSALAVSEVIHFRYLAHIQGQAARPPSNRQ
jgi:hypothetical protein